MQSIPRPPHPPRAGYEHHAERLLARVRVDEKSGCWEWQGYHDSKGYSRQNSRREPRQTNLAHRALYECFFELAPDRPTLDHVCRNRGCVNPLHLEQVTQAENTLRSLAPTALKARQTHCIRGHAFDERNTYMTRAGSRMCRACCAWRARQRKARQLAEPEQGENGND